MTYMHNSKKYKSKKHPVLEYIFDKYNPNKDTSKKSILFTLKDVSDGYRSLGIPEPASISNTILDLTRKNNHISSRLPEGIYGLGYDLVKMTGKSPNGESYAGEFVYLGIGIAVESWLTWPDTLREMQISSNGIPHDIRQFLRNDEGALFSVIDYCDIFSQVLYDKQQRVIRVQNPMKWQPNEIDGFYYGNINGAHTIFPVEAKALTTKDDINLVQLRGGVVTILTKFRQENFKIIPLAVQMIENGIRIAVFEECHAGQLMYTPKLVDAVKVTFNPVISSWK